MIRYYSKYRIRRSIDQGQEFPRWLRVKMELDPDLLRYAQTYSRMLQHLSTSAESWMQEEMKSCGPSEELELEHSLGIGSLEPTANSLNREIRATRLGKAQALDRGSSSIRWSMATAALLLVIAGWAWAQRSSWESRRARETAHQAQLTLVATRAVWNEGQRTARRGLDACEQAIQKVSFKVADRLVESAVEPVEESGRWLGLTIRELHRGARQEQNNLWELVGRLGSALDLVEKNE